jgi:hypothetical protein
MDSGAMIYIASFIKIASGIQKLIGEDTEYCNLIGLLLFFRNKESRIILKWILEK